jgi:hypothetical protein
VNQGLHPKRDFNAEDLNTYQKEKLPILVYHHIVPDIFLWNLFLQVTSRIFPD